MFATCLVSHSFISPNIRSHQKLSKSAKTKKNPAIIEDNGALNGEPAGARTRDPLIKSQMLYRLSYRPTKYVSKEAPVAKLSHKQGKG
jgi:hypothetical protein